MAANIPREGDEVLPVSSEGDTRPLERGKRERRLGDRQHRRPRRTERAQILRALLGIEGVGQFRHR
jgi:hypothetical protein